MTGSSKIQMPAKISSSDWRSLAAFTLSSAAAVTVAAIVSASFARDVLLRWAIRDTTVRANLIGAAVENIVTLTPSGGALDQALDDITRDERLYALGLCDREGRLKAHSRLFPPSLECRENDSGRSRISWEGLDLRVARVSLSERSGDGTLIALHDLAYATRRISETYRYLVVFFFLLFAAITITVVIALRSASRHWSSRLWGILLPGGVPSSAQLGTSASEAIRQVQKLLEQVKEVRESEPGNAAYWSAESLQRLLDSRLVGNRVLVVSNREPYSHVRREGAIEATCPVSGLVTALEPVLVASKGTWIAHGSGPADWEVVDEHDRIPVPPGDPHYTLRRIRLSKEEEAGYYAGFSNEGLWPLCLLAHTRPIFRRADWEQYRAVNLRFADAVIEEAEATNPVVLVQDFHFCLLPAAVRERLPNATIITFWHIAWPSPDMFAICPWGKELVEGLLGSSILGFHTAKHCANFLETVGRHLEAKIDWEQRTVMYQGHLTVVRDYPISIDPATFPPAEAGEDAASSETIHARYGLPDGVLIILGIDRLDYVKGIAEKISACDRFLEKHPEWAGRCCLVQVAPPSRSILPAYQAYAESVRAAAQAVNARWSHVAVPPILLAEQQIDQTEVADHLRAAAVCLVMSLDDGMNLVAKEFVCARSDHRGVLILSRFTGASLELSEALIVNPYDTEECADALFQALTMSPDEQKLRMQRMRARVSERNIFRWAGRMLLDAAEARERGSLERIVQSEVYFRGAH